MRLTFVAVGCSAEIQTIERKTIEGSRSKYSWSKLILKLFQPIALLGMVVTDDQIYKPSKNIGIFLKN